MNLPDCRAIAFEQGILAEPNSGPNRVVLWVPGNRDASFQHWERIGNVVRAEISSEGGLCATAATAVPARQRLRAGLGQLFKGLRRSSKDRDFLLPDGASSEQCGERRTDLLLVWSLDPESPVDLMRIQSLWPTAHDFRRLSQNLFLVSGVATRTKSADEQAEPQPEQISGNPREQAEGLVAAARRAGDRTAEATALTDLGVTQISEGKPAEAVASLQSALAIARELGDAERQNDIIGNLGLALLGVGQAPQARQAFEQCLGYVRSKRDHLGEKTTMERLGLAHWHLREYSVALSCFEQALSLARLVGDRMQAANLLWYQGIQHAELGQRELAITKAEESIELFKAMGRPQAAWYGSHLQKYRMGLYEEAPAAVGAGVNLSPQSYLGGAIVASVMPGGPAQSQAGSQPNSGPGLLRMAMSATKAMATFVSSGMKATPPSLQQKRIQTCMACEHHTGMRCKICGCFTHVKSRMAHEDCPIGKWPA
jgi:tetratricopeptide (TPR) repeat protein